MDTSLRRKIDMFLDKEWAELLSICCFLIGHPEGYLVIHRCLEELFTGLSHMVEYYSAFCG